MTYTWAFGDGGRGGSSSVAHIFMAAGSFEVRLTVTDPSGSSNSMAKTITVSSRTVAAGAAVGVAGTVLDVSGAVLPGAKVELVGGAVTGSSDAAGKVALSLATAPRTLWMSSMLLGFTMFIGLILAYPLLQEPSARRLRAREEARTLRPQVLHHL